MILKPPKLGLSLGDLGFDVELGLGGAKNKRKGVRKQWPTMLVLADSALLL